MDSATTKPAEKRLGEFLKEQQEPFILEAYLLERGYSKRWNSKKSNHGDDYSGNTKNLERSASCGFNRKRKALFPFSKVITTLHKKLAFRHNQKCTPDEHVNVTASTITSLPHRHEPGSLDQTILETERFSTASSSTVFNSCSVSDVEEQDGTSLQSQKDKPLFSLDTCSKTLQSQQATNNGKHRHICIDGSPLQQSQNNETLNQDDSGMEQRIRSCGVLVPKKITEDSLLSAALWSLLIQSAKRESYGYKKELRDLIGPNVSQILKSKGVLHKTKQLLFDCIREITITTLPRKDDDDDDDDGERGFKKFMGPEELGRIICERTKEWGQIQAGGGGGDETNLTYLLTLDYLNSVNEWSKFEHHVKAITVEIADAILERVTYEIVSDMI